MSSGFIDLCLQLGVLRFGEFKLKSGRVSPYFFNFVNVTYIIVWSVVIGTLSLVSSFVIISGVFYL